MLQFKNERIVPDCIVRISSEKDISKYIQAVVRRCQPDVYDKYKCIKLRYIKSLETQARYICRVFWNCGLVPKQKIKNEEGIKVDRGVIVGDAREVVLVKVPAIVFDDNSEFEEWWNNHPYE